MRLFVFVYFFLFSSLVPAACVYYNGCAIACDDQLDATAVRVYLDDNSCGGDAIGYCNDYYFDSGDELYGYCSFLDKAAFTDKFNMGIVCADDNYVEIFWVCDKNLEPSDSVSIDLEPLLEKLDLVLELLSAIEFLEAVDNEQNEVNRLILLEQLSEMVDISVGVGSLESFLVEILKNDVEQLEEVKKISELQQRMEYFFKTEVDLAFRLEKIQDYLVEKQDDTLTQMLENLVDIRNYFLNGGKDVEDSEGEENPACGAGFGWLQNELGNCSCARGYIPRTLPSGKICDCADGYSRKDGTENYFDSPCVPESTVPVSSEDIQNDIVEEFGGEGGEGENIVLDVETTEIDLSSQVLGFMPADTGGSCSAFSDVPIEIFLPSGTAIYYFRFSLLNGFTDLIRALGRVFTGLIVIIIFFRV